MTIFLKFVWCCELTTRAFYQKDQVLGEIIIDATSAADAKTDSFIIIHYPNAVCYRRPEDYFEMGDAVFRYVMASLKKRVYLFAKRASSVEHSKEVAHCGYSK